MIRQHFGTPRRKLQHVTVLSSKQRFTFFLIFQSFLIKMLTICSQSFTKSLSLCFENIFVRYGVFLNAKKKVSGKKCFCAEKAKQILDTYEFVCFEQLISGNEYRVLVFYFPKPAQVHESIVKLCIQAKSIFKSSFRSIKKFLKICFLIQFHCCSFLFFFLDREKICERWNC